MDQKMIERAVDAAAKAQVDALYSSPERKPWERKPWDERSEVFRDERRSGVRPIVTAALESVEAALTAERDYYRGLLDHHGKCICNMNPATMDGPDEFCPWHGRPYTDILEWGEKQAERIARVEALLPDEDDPYVHVHPLPGGEPDCGGCWDADIRKALRVGGE